MAWWWSSNSSGAKPDSQSTTPPLVPTASTPPPSSPIQPSHPPSVPHPDADFHAAYPHLAPPAKPNTLSTPFPSSEPTTAPPRPLSDEYPTTMSCRAAFDSAFYCSSFGGKFNDIYRYGELRPCSEHWADWRFCMGLKVYSGEDKARRIQDMYREKEERVRARPNSEDVWERRGEGEKVVGAFRVKPEEGDGR